MALNLYDVQVRNHVTTMKLSDDAAKAMKADGYELTRAGSTKPAQRQDVLQPPHAVDEDGNDLPASSDGNARVRSRSRSGNGRDVQTASRQPEDK
jgi:hypothetical protein